MLKERPILMSAPMVRALLAGTKTQTRRVVKPRDIAWMDEHQGLREPDNATIRPYGQPGDRLWVRETFCDDRKDSMGVQYRADGGLDSDMYDAGCKWRPSIHMPRWASRITLDITEVRVERLQEIGEADAIAEGLAELVPHLKRSEGLAPTALAFAAAATVAEMPRASRRAFLGGALAAALGFPASPSRQWEVLAARMARAPSPQQLYALLWDSINGPGTWDANPWVWAISFRRVNG